MVRQLLPSDRATWYALREFETHDITARSYKERHLRDLPLVKGREIVASFAQAREYFTSAHLADHTVRPLLQYYGVATLSRGLVLFLSPGLRETQLKEGHGLERRAWKDVLQSSPVRFADLGVSLSSGLFRHLLDTVACKSYFRHRSHEVNISISLPVPGIGTKFTLGDIAARIPDLSDQHAAWLGKRPPFIPMGSFSSDDSGRRFEFALPKNILGPTSMSVPGLSEPGVETMFPKDECPNRSVDGTGDSVIVSYDQPFLPFLAQQSEHSGVGHIVIYSPLESKQYFNPLTACFTLSFILGMLCRYFPTTWVTMANSEKGDAIYPFIIRASDWIQETFPALVVDILRGPYYFEQ